MPSKRPVTLPLFVASTKAENARSDTKARGKNHETAARRAREVADGVLDDIAEWRVWGSNPGVLPRGHTLSGLIKAEKEAAFDAMYGQMAADREFDIWKAQQVPFDLEDSIVSFANEYAPYARARSIHTSHQEPSDDPWYQDRWGDDRRPVANSVANLFLGSSSSSSASSSSSFINAPELTSRSTSAKARRTGL